MGRRQESDDALVCVVSCTLAVLLWVGVERKKETLEAFSTRSNSPAERRMAFAASQSLKPRYIRHLESSSSQTSSTDSADEAFYRVTSSMHPSNARELLVISSWTQKAGEIDERAQARVTRISAKRGPIVGHALIQ